jgi:two-component system, OmpR family, sensor kinase
VKSLRSRLFAATLGALALTLGLSLVIGGALTRRQVDRTQASSLAARADDLASERRQHVNYIHKDVFVGSVHILIQTRDSFEAVVPDVNRSSDGTTTYNGERQLYSYRTIPTLGLIVLRPANAGSTAWRPYAVDLLIAALAGVALALAISFLLARSIVNPLRRIAAATRALANDETHEPLPHEGTTELAALAEAFNHMVENLATSRQAERDFLLSVSHELKTPLTAIRGYTEGLADGAFDVDEATSTILVEAQRLERLVRDLLDLARMNRSEFSVSQASADLAEVAREAVRRHETTAREFNVHLRWDGSESWVIADGDRLLQVASNLVENALRVTPAGGEVTLTTSPATLTVSDTGPGIAPEDAAHAFERFYLYDRASKDRAVGSGLGLAIVQQLVTAMGGTVTVESRVGAGTRFVVRLRASGMEAGGVDDLEVPPRQPAERV